MLSYFYCSSLLKCRSGTLRKITIEPGEQSSFWRLVRTPGLPEHLARFCDGVEHLTIRTFHDDYNLTDSNPAIYLPLFRGRELFPLYFEEHNPGLSLEAFHTFFRNNQRDDLIEEITWEGPGRKSETLKRESSR